ncbi:MAG TPA: polysaccharide deacetylase family protein [Bacillota bacterium]|nr:polysaccharide deacetylase family protein [Bacillota bacterium]HQE02730.1 polysaccharide deacetylase family protein [Bacillota bacterium]
MTRPEFGWKKRWRVLIKAALVPLTLALALTGCSTATVAPASKKLPIYCVARDDNKLAISFDAAWGTEYTGEILDILDEYNIKTTFFVVQFWVEKYPEVAREIIRRGHELGNHSSTHPEMGNLSPGAIQEEVMGAHRAIKEVTGYEPILFRPPFGHYSPAMLEVIEGMGYYVIQWDVDSLDWKERGVDDVVARVTAQAGPGSIILFHNNAKYITQALPLILDDFRRRNLEVVPISQLIYTEDYYIDHEGRQHKKSSGP